jgi:hypothetical protein
MSERVDPELDGPVAPELGGLAAWAPGAHAALVRAWRATEDEVDPALLRLARAAVESQLGLTSSAEAEPETEVEAALVALTDQFVFYVPDVSPDLLAPVERELGADGLSKFVEALYIVDQTARMRISLGRLFAEQPPPPRAPSDGVRAPSVGDAINELHAEAMLLDGLDPLTTEVVRLRAANYHDCKT